MDNSRAESRQVPAQDKTQDQTHSQAQSGQRTQQPVEIRRNARLSACVGLVAAVMTIAYLNRASGTGAFWDWALCVVMAAIAVSQLISLVDARTPLLVADSHGVRIRLAQEWLGVPWAALEQVLVEQRDMPLRDGRLVLRARNLGNALESLDAGARREVRWQRRLHGAPLTVPLSLGTRCSSDDLVGDLRALSDRRADVTLVTGAERALVADGRARKAPAVPTPTPAADAKTARRAELTAQRAEKAERRAQARADKRADRAAAREQARVQREAHEAHVAREADTAATAEDAEVSTVGASRPPHTDHTGPSTTEQTDTVAAPARPLPAPVAAIRAARSGVRREATSGPRPQVARTEEPRRDEELIPSGLVSPVGTVSIDEFAPKPVAQPVIGPEIRSARERSGLSIDQLSERTMVRPHVLEGIEVDDFGPCGGDFYARGHLRTLARYLGLDAERLIEDYDERYSHAPINARRVFEAELATGLSGGMRATTGGPRWSLLVAAVLSLLMIWGVARFFTDEPVQVASPSSSVDTAGLAGNRVPITSSLTKARLLTVNVTGGVAQVEVRDGHGDKLWDGKIRDGGRREIVGVGPFKVKADKGAWVHVKVGGADKGTVGTDLTPATRKVS